MTTDITTRAAASTAQASNRRQVAAERIDQAELERLLLDPTEPDSSLAGNSGFAVLDLATGGVAFRDTNYAVAADIVGAALARTSVRASASVIPAAGGEEGGDRGPNRKSCPHGRTGRPHALT